MADRPLFLDTGFVIALLDQTDVYHAPALAWARRLERERRPLVTTTSVLIELGDAFGPRGSWARYQAFVEALLQDPRATVVEVDRGLFDRACALRAQRADKRWGLTDCLSFVVMADHDLRAALACDRHFVQAGFRALLLEADDP